MSDNKKTSEYVTIGHPDKVADFISEYILDRLLEADPDTRYALECQIKDEFVSLAGEVTTKARNWKQHISEYVKEAVASIGYTEAYQKKFGGDKYTISSKDITISCLNVRSQSPDIAQGVDRKGWGDQGIFFGLWNGQTPEGYGKDYALAKQIGQFLYQKALDNKSPYGIDIKTQVTYDVDEKQVTQVVVAIPTIDDGKDYSKDVKALIKKEFPETKKAKFIINGTGAYHIHGPVGDSGTTGRKLVVDFYGSGSRIGGGSPWTKDPTKADLTLNIFARELAKLSYFQWEDEISGLERVETELSCCIGKQNVLCVTTVYDWEGIPRHRVTEERKVPTDFLIKRYNMKMPKYAYLCKEGLFSDGLEG